MIDTISRHNTRKRLAQLAQRVFGQNISLLVGVGEVIMFAFFAELLHCTKAYGPLSIDRWHSGRFGQNMFLKIENLHCLE